MTTRCPRWTPSVLFCNSWDGRNDASVDLTLSSRALLACHNWPVPHGVTVGGNLLTTVVGSNLENSTVTMNARTNNARPWAVAGWPQMAFLLIAFLSWGANADADALPSNSWQIEETLGTFEGVDAIYYTVTNNHPTDPITAFAVGFNSADLGSEGDAEMLFALNVMDFNHFAFASNDTWSGDVVDEMTWGGSGGKYFGISWQEFQAFDDGTTEFAAIFRWNNDSGSPIDPGVTYGGTSEEQGTYIGVTNAVLMSPAVVLVGGQTFGGPAGSFNSFSANAVPEPEAAVLGLLGILGLLGFVAWRRFGR